MVQKIKSEGALSLEKGNSLIVFRLPFERWNEGAALMDTFWKKGTMCARQPAVEKN